MPALALDYRAMVNDPADLEGNAQITPVSLSTTGADSAALSEGIYDVWCDVNCYIKVGDTPNDVTTSTGYLLVAGNVVPLIIRQGKKLGGVVSTGTGTLSAHRVR